jgi:four helix bundle protein
LAPRVFAASREFPRGETYSLTDQVRRSSRSVCANIAEAWRKRRYEAAFVSKLSDSEAETAETQVWIELAVRCGYLSKPLGKELFDAYELLLGSITGIINNKDNWTRGVKEEGEVYEISDESEPF